MRFTSFLFGSEQAGSARDALALTALRVVAGLSLSLGHGLGKIPVSERFVEGVSEMGFPLPWVFGWAAALSEFVGGLFLAAGFLTRPASLFIGFTVGTALFVRHAADPFAAKEKALLFMFIALMFLVRGASRYSVDALLRTRLAQTPAPTLAS